MVQVSLVFIFEKVLSMVRSGITVYIRKFIFLAYQGKVLTTKIIGCGWLDTRSNLCAVY